MIRRTDTDGPIATATALPADEGAIDLSIVDRIVEEIAHGPLCGTRATGPETASPRAFGAWTVRRTADGATLLTGARCRATRWNWWSRLGLGAYRWLCWPVPTPPRPRRTAVLPKRSSLCRFPLMTSLGDGLARATAEPGKTSRSGKPIMATDPQNTQSCFSMLPAPFRSPGTPTGRPGAVCRRRQAFSPRTAPHESPGLRTPLSTKGPSRTASCDVV